MLKKRISSAKEVSEKKEEQLMSMKMILKLRDERIKGLEAAAASGEKNLDSTSEENVNNKTHALFVT